MNPMQPQDGALKSLHACFIHESGGEHDARISDRTYRVNERAYLDFLDFGYSVEDLRIVMRFVKSENKRMSGAAHSLRLDRLLDFEYRRFDALLKEAMARERNKIRPATPKETVLEAWRPSACERVAGNGVHRISEFLKQPNQ